MAKFVRAGNKGINLERVLYYEVSDALGGTVGRGASASSGAQAALILFFSATDRLAIQNVDEARIILHALKTHE